MQQQASPLPEFDNPPVSEVAVSVEFLPIERWLTPHAGLYWAQIAKEYPDTESHPPLSSQIEKFGDEFWKSHQTMRLELGDPDAARFWFLAVPPTRLIQVQRDRFIVNWRKVQGDEIYPRYEKEIRPRFEREWARFKQFVLEKNLGGIDVRQCEVTYVNDIPRDVAHDMFSDLGGLFAPWSGNRSEGFLPAAETLSITGSFRMPEERGRLRFTTQHLRRRIDNKEVIQLNLAARGEPSSNSDKDILEWMDLGHEWVVRGFTDLTTPEAHQRWNRMK